VEDEFRVTLELDGSVDAEAFECLLADGLGPEHEISRHKETLRLYADDEATARRMAEEVRAAAAALPAELAIDLKRWNPGSGEWQDPKLPVERLEPDRDPDPDPADLDFESLQYEVTVRSPERLPEGIERRLLREGESVFAQGESHRRLWAGAASEAEALLLAGHLQLETPPGSTIEVRPLTWWRRWLARERLFGNYAEGGGGGGGG
jgi:peptidoglycan/xylan/chitin deacetylase (PgdA/CDA1 family)